MPKLLSELLPDKTRGEVINARVDDIEFYENGIMIKLHKDKFLTIKHSGEIAYYKKGGAIYNPITEKMTPIQEIKH